jgi:hypothetical protein
MTEHEYECRVATTLQLNALAHGRLPDLEPGGTHFLTPVMLQVGAGSQWLTVRARLARAGRPPLALCFDVKREGYFALPQGTCPPDFRALLDEGNNKVRELLEGGDSLS